MRTSTNPPPAKINSRPPFASSDALTAVTAAAGSVNLERFDGDDGMTVGPLSPALYRFDLHMISMGIMPENYKKSGKPSLKEARNRAGFVVTARKREENAQDVPVAVTAIDGAEFDSNGTSQVQQLQFQAPSPRLGPSWFCSRRDKRNSINKPNAILLLYTIAPYSVLAVRPGVDADHELESLTRIDTSIKGVDRHFFVIDE